MKIIYPNEDVHSKIKKIIIEWNDKKKKYDTQGDHRAQLTIQLKLKVVDFGTNPHDGENFSSTNQWQKKHGEEKKGRGVDLSLVMITPNAITD